MIRAYLGDDPVTVRARAHAFLEKSGAGEAARVTVETYVPGLFIELAQSQSLFGSPAPVILDYLDEDEEIAAALLGELDTLAESERLFIHMGYAPSAAAKKAFTKSGIAYEEVAPAPQGERFNTFALADALARKDKKTLWLLLQRASRAGVPGEEVAGVIFWQMKALRLAAQTKSAKEAGMKDFPYNKAKGALKHWKNGELEHVSEALLSVYHAGHKDADMDIGLERLVLRM